MKEMHGRYLTLGSAGMRGLVGPGLTPGAAGDFAAAFAGFAGPGRILVGRDTRTSSDMLALAVSAALAGSGCEVTDGGVLTAGMMHFLIPALGYDGGVMITGGHQRPGWNALIPLAGDGSYFDHLRQRELFDRYLGRRFTECRAEAVKPFRPLEEDALPLYWDWLEGQLDAPALRSAHLTFVGDFCNGAGSPYAQEFARRIGARLIALNDTPSGVIPRDPEPRPRSGSPLRSIMQPLGAAAGLIFNSDMSRLELVSDPGEPLSEEMTFPLAADYLLRRSAPGGVVVTNVCSSRTIDDVAARHGATVEKTRVGQAAVIDRARQTDAVLAGEGSGSFATPALRGFDGFLMAGLLLEAIAVTGRSICEQVRELPRYEMVKQAVPADSPHAYQLLRRMSREFGDDDVEITETDGLRFDWPDGFLSLRLSATESTLRLISEAKSRELASERAWKARLSWERM